MKNTKPRNYFINNFSLIGFTACKAKQSLRTRREVIGNRSTQRLKNTVNLFKKNMQVKDVC